MNYNVNMKVLLAIFAFAALQSSLFAQAEFLDRLTKGQVGSVGGSFKLTYVRELPAFDRSEMYVYYQDGKQFMYERYLLRDGSDPVFDGMFLHDGVTYQSLMDGRLQVTRDLDKLPIAKSSYGPTNPLFQYVSPIVRLNNNCEMAYDSEILVTALSDCQLHAESAGELSRKDEDTDLTLKLGTGGLLGMVEGVVDGVTTEFRYDGTVDVAGAVVPKVTSIKYKAVEGGWREWIARADHRETIKVLEEESEELEEGYLSELLRVPRKLVKVIDDLDLGVSTVEGNPSED